MTDFSGRYVKKRIRRFHIILPDNNISTFLTDWLLLFVVFNDNFHPVRNSDIVPWVEFNDIWFYVNYRAFVNGVRFGYLQDIPLYFQEADYLCQDRIWAGRAACGRTVL